MTATLANSLSIERKRCCRKRREEQARQQGASADDGDAEWRVSALIVSGIRAVISGPNAYSRHTAKVCFSTEAKCVK